MEPGFTRIVNDGLGPDSVSVVPESSLPHWHRCGWRQVTGDDVPPAEPAALAEVAGAAETAETTEEQ